MISTFCADLIVNIDIAVLVAINRLTRCSNIIMSGCRPYIAILMLDLAVAVSPVIGSIITRLCASWIFCRALIVPAIYTVNISTACVVAIFALDNISLTIAVIFGESTVTFFGNIPSVRIFWSTNYICLIACSLAVWADSITFVPGMEGLRVIIYFIFAGCRIKHICFAIYSGYMGCFFSRLEHRAVRCFHRLCNSYEHGLILVFGVYCGKHCIYFADASFKVFNAVKIISLDKFNGCNKLRIAAELAGNISPTVFGAAGLNFNTEVIINVVKSSIYFICLISKFFDRKSLTALLAVAYGKTFVAAACSLDDHGLAGLALPALVPEQSKCFDFDRDRSRVYLAAFLADFVLYAGSFLLSVFLDANGGILMLMSIRCRLLRSRKDSGSRQQGRDHENRHQHANQSLFHVSS